MFSSNDIQTELLLRQAAAKGDLNTVKKLCEAGINRNATGASSHKTALHWAAQAGFWGIVSYLMSDLSKLNLHAKDADDNSALHLACSGQGGLIRDRLAIIELMLNKGMDPLAKNKSGVTAFNSMTILRDSMVVRSDSELANKVASIINKIKSHIENIARETRQSATLSPNGTVNFFANVTSLENSQEAKVAMQHPDLQIKAFGFN